MHRGKVLIERNSGLTSSTSISSASSISLLDREATSKGPSKGSVPASHIANVARGSSNTIEVLWHLDVDGEGCLLRLGEPIRARDVVGDF